MKWSLSSLGFDTYERRARLYPGLITIFPAIAVPLVLFPRALLQNWGATLVTVFTYVGLFYLMANLARGEGKRVEPGLLSKWGGWPSTIILRHSDPTIDPYTKKRYHQALKKIAPDVPLPSPETEEANPFDADLAYRSATMKLLETRRGEKYRLMHDGNAEYGFRRNMLGLRPWAIIITVIVCMVVLLIWWHRFRSGAISENLILEDLAIRWRIYFLVFSDLAALFFWCFYVRERWVRQAAFDFARALFRTLESTNARR
ncbi:MAG: hypothetical protein ACLQBA_21700 [Candidatus Binataceae bacterium]